jgi:hypothetical protein
MSMDDGKAEDELLTKVLREPFEYNTPIISSPHVENESQTSHYHPQFNEKDYLSKYSAYSFVNYVGLRENVLCLLGQVWAMQCYCCFRAGTARNNVNNINTC